MPDLGTYRCTVVLTLTDATKEVAEQFFRVGADVEGASPVHGYVAIIESSGAITKDLP